MDMDSTAITVECIDELADIAGKKAEVSSITTAAMRGEIDFVASLRRRVALLEGLQSEALVKVLRERLKLSRGVEQFINDVHAASIDTILLSGGFTFFAEAVKEMLNLTEVVANRLELGEDGALTGRLQGPIIDGWAKKQAVLTYCDAHRIPSAACIAIGDGANDVPMLQAAGLSIAYHAKPAVYESADQSVRFGGFEVVTDWFTKAS